MESPEQKNKRLEKEIAKLKAAREADKAKLPRCARNLKKRRAENNTDRRINEVSFEPVPGHRFSVQIIVLCILLYMRTNCGLRTVVTILKTFKEVMEGAAGKVPSYSTVRNWVLRLGLSVYEDEKSKGWKYIAVQDESIWVNRQKLLLTLGIPYKHEGRPVEHKDIVVLDMNLP